MLGFLEAGFSETLPARSQADHNILSLLALSCFWDEFLMFGWPGNNLHRPGGLLLEAAFISVSKLFWLQVQATTLGLGYRKDFKSGTTFNLGRGEMVGLWVEGQPNASSRTARGRGFYPQPWLHQPPASLSRKPVLEVRAVTSASRCSYRLPP